MAVNIFTRNITVTMRDAYSRYWDLSGLYCRTQISV